MGNTYEIMISEQSIANYDEMTAAECEDVNSALCDIERRIVELCDVPVRIRMGEGPSWDVACERLAAATVGGAGGEIGVPAARIREIIESGLERF